MTVEQVDITTDADDPSTLWIDIGYTVRSTNDRRNLVFPFYVIPADRTSDRTEVRA